MAARLRPFSDEARAGREDTGSPFRRRLARICCPLGISPRLHGVPQMHTGNSAWRTSNSNGKMGGDFWASPRAHQNLRSVAGHATTLPACRAPADQESPWQQASQCRLGLLPKPPGASKIRDRVKSAVMAVGFVPARNLARDGVRWLRRVRHQRSPASLRAAAPAPCGCRSSAAA